LRENFRPQEKATMMTKDKPILRASLGKKLEEPKIAHSIST